jgi:hypothetical protein
LVTWYQEILKENKMFLVVLLAVGVAYYIGSKRCCQDCQDRKIAGDPIKPARSRGREGVDIDFLEKKLEKISAKKAPSKGKKK